jgi:hypothetical protein
VFDLDARIHIIGCNNKKEKYMFTAKLTLTHETDLEKTIVSLKLLNTNPSELLTQLGQHLEIVQHGYEEWPVEDPESYSDKVEVVVYPAGTWGRGRAVEVISKEKA